MEKNPEDSALKTAHAAVALVGLVLVLGAVPSYGVHIGVSVACGSAIASSNLWVLSKTVRRLVRGTSASWVGVALTKFFVLMAVVYGLIHGGVVEPLALSVGFGSLPVGILLASALGSAQAGSGETTLKREQDHA